MPEKQKVAWGACTVLVLHPDAFCRNSSALKISTYTIGPFCVSVPATPMDTADSVRDADNIRVNKKACWGWCQAPQPNTRGELAPARTIYVILGDAWSSQTTCARQRTAHALVHFQNLFCNFHHRQGHFATLKWYMFTVILILFLLSR